MLESINNHIIDIVLLYNYNILDCLRLLLISFIAVLPLLIKGINVYFHS